LYAFLAANYLIKKPADLPTKKDPHPADKGYFEEVNLLSLGASHSVFDMYKAEAITEAAV
jgi:hypothetical protein